MVETLSGTRAVRTDEALAVGTRVDVRSRFVGQWSRGFEVAEQVDDEAYRVRRLSDGSILPDRFMAEELRPERRRTDFWWY
ncbi:MAG TPA: hypothetical protein VE991_07555 [Acidimicrobiales bacterium]|nr:hypothetical protein [Acidimicrobiales bacterium]